MKLAEALLERADLQRRMAQLRQRIGQNAQYQEGETPAENPNDLLAEYLRANRRWQDLLVAINLANSHIILADGSSMTAALAKRDALKNEHAVLTTLADAATPEQLRYSRSEIKVVAAVEVKAVRKQADEVAKTCRELDAQIQQANWAHDLPAD